MGRTRQFLVITLAVASTVLIVAAVWFAPLLLFALGSLPGRESLAVCVWFLAGPCAFILIARMSGLCPAAIPRTSLTCLLALVPAFLLLYRDSNAVRLSLVFGVPIALHLLLIGLFREKAGPSAAPAAGIGRSALRAGCLLGFIGFIIGFVGPAVFTPDDKEGPLLGIFYTGPAGFVLGLLGGAIAFHHRSRQKRDGAP